MYFFDESKCDKIYDLKWLMKIVYIDAQNIHKGIQELWWIIDWVKLFYYLKKRYDVDQILIFFWYLPKYQYLYTFLSKTWYKVVFKEITVHADGSIKGNVDIDIAIRAMNDIMRDSLDEAYLMTTDSDFNSLIYEFRRRNVRWKLIVTHFLKTSKYLRKASGDVIQALTDIKHIIQKTN